MGVITITDTAQAFVGEFNALAAEIHQIAVDKGWWEEDRNNGEIAALMHEEISEAYDAHLEGNGPSQKILEFTHVEEEFADLLIRIADMAPSRGWRVAEVIAARLEPDAGPPRTGFVSAFNARRGLAWWHLSNRDTWWRRNQDMGSRIAKLHSYLSRVVNAMRMPGDPPDTECPGYSLVESRLADVVLALMAMSWAWGNERIAEATLAKIQYNRGRPYRHGGKKF